MPSFLFRCKDPECAQLRRVIKSEVPKKAPSCKECGGKTSREWGGPSTHLKENLDNGLMSKSVERFANVEELIHKRQRKRAIE